MRAGEKRDEEQNVFEPAREIKRSSECHKWDKAKFLYSISSSSAIWAKLRGLIITSNGKHIWHLEIAPGNARKASEHGSSLAVHSSHWDNKVFDMNPFLFKPIFKKKEYILNWNCTYISTKLSLIRLSNQPWHQSDIFPEGMALQLNRGVYERPIYNAHTRQHHVVNHPFSITQ